MIAGPGGLPRDLVQAFEREFGQAPDEARPVAGGCIATVLRLRLHHGASACAKLAPACAEGVSMLEAEAAGLAALAATGTVRVPRLLAAGTSWLLLEWLEPGYGGAGQWRALGRSLARLHAVRTPSFGHDRDNFIGTLPQWNTPHMDWAAFWWEERLEPQLAHARSGGLLTAALGRRFQQLHRELPELLALAQEEGASLLHGDLWSGNVLLAAEGEPALIDPACYCGHREVDLAMAALFGGFDPAFWQAYDESWPLQRAGLERRRAVYQLYYLLVHVNLFGASYLSRTAATLERALQPGR